jgi:ketosteroid isomerase-like protein
VAEGRYLSPGMTSRGERLIRQAYRAFAARDVDALAALADEAIEVSTVTGLLSGRTEPYRGYTGLEEYMADLASTWKRIELQPQQFNTLDDERILVFGRVRAWHERGFLDSSNAWLWTLRGDRVASVQVFADPSEARAAFFNNS